jgi:adenine-specific DNA methylase
MLYIPYRVSQQTIGLDNSQVAHEQMNLLVVSYNQEQSHQMELIQIFYGQCLGAGLPVL